MNSEDVVQIFFCFQPMKHVSSEENVGIVCFAHKRTKESPIMNEIERAQLKFSTHTNTYKLEYTGKIFVSK